MTEEEEGRQEAPRRRDDAEEEQVVSDEQEAGADGGDLHGVPEGREKPTGTGSSSSNNICSVCHEPWASSGAHRIWYQPYPPDIVATTTSSRFVLGGGFSVLCVLLYHPTCFFYLG